MYFGNVILMIGVPLAFGSYWGLLIVHLLASRCWSFVFNDEEALLTQQLAGYREYMQKVH